MSTKPRIFILSAALCFLIGAVWFFRGAPVPVAKPLRANGPVIAFGDSLVEGVGSQSGGWVPLVASRAGVPIENEGKSGDTTASALLRFEPMLRERGPRIVIMLLGGNDAISRVPASAVESNLLSMIRAVRSSGGAVLLLGIRSGFLAQPYEGVFERLSREDGVSYVPDILDGIFGNARLMDDTIHPNDAGYARMAERITPPLAKMLE